jgi:starvation-inducible outer membrane lipoprotein
MAAEKEITNMIEKESMVAQTATIIVDGLAIGATVTVGGEVTMVDKNKTQTAGEIAEGRTATAEDHGLLYTDGRGRGPSQMSQK